MSRQRSIFIFLFFLLLGCGSPYNNVLVEAESTQGPILIKGVSIFNGRDSTLLLEKDVLIENGLIADISIGIERDDVLIIDGSNKTLMPGLIDAHVHLTGSGAVPWENVMADEEYNLSAYLYAGITTIYDLGGLGGSLEKLSNRVAEGKILGPSIYHAHIPITTKDSHPIPLSEEILPWPLSAMVSSISPVIEKPEEAEKLIAKYVKKEVDYVKIICDQIPAGSPEMSFELLKALIDESHKLNFKALVHIGSPENAIDALRAGADALAHGIWRGELTASQADQIADFQKPIIYTVAALQNVSEIKNGAFSPAPMDTFLVPQSILAPVTGENGFDVKNQPVMNAFFEDVASKNSYLEKNFQLLAERGVPIILGTDSSLPGTYAGSTFHQELAALNQLGLSNYEVLKGATYLSSRLFLENPNFGLVEKRQRADLLLIDGNPLQDLSLLKDPALIISRGRIVNRL